MRENPSFRIEVLDETHQLGSFNCGDKTINGFLLDQALNQQESGYSITYVLCEGQSVSPASFATLLTGQLLLKKPRFGPFPDLPHKEVPGILLGRLGTDIGFQNKGYGSDLIKFAIALADGVRQKVGCRVVFLDAYRSLAGFYERLGFQVGSRDHFDLSDRRRSVMMWLDLQAGS